MPRFNCENVKSLSTNLEYLGQPMTQRNSKARIL